MTDPKSAERLRDIEARIARLKGETQDAPRVEEHYSQAQVAWRMVTELVAGLGIGFAIGMGLDALFGTEPFLMVVFIFLGLAAGVRVMMRTAQAVQEQQMGGADAPGPGEDKGA